MSAMPAQVYALAVFSGLSLGVCYFLLLARAARLHVSGVSVARIIPLYALRVAVALGVFWMAAQYGALALLLTLAGFLLGRVAVQYREAKRT